MMKVQRTNVSTKAEQLSLVSQHHTLVVVLHILAFVSPYLHYALPRMSFLRTCHGLHGMRCVIVALVLVVVISSIAASAPSSPDAHPQQQRHQHLPNVDGDTDEVVNQAYQRDALGPGREPFPARAEGWRVRWAAVVTRHGDRTPTKVYPGGRRAYAQDLGQLTPLGAHQLYGLGARFRQLYVHDSALLSPHYVSHEVRFRSTDRDRTLESAHAFAAGLFPAGTGPWVGPPEDEVAALPHRVQSVPIHSEAKQTDTLLYAYKNCPVLKTFRAVDQQGPTWKNGVRPFEPLLNQLSTLFEANLTFGDFTSINAMVKYERNHPEDRFDLPLTEEQQQGVENAANFEFSRKFPHRQAGRLAGGNLVKRILQRMEKVVQQNGQPQIAGVNGVNRKKLSSGALKARKQDTERFILYSAHDGTLMAVIAALGWTSHVAPQYASHFVFELCQSEHDANDWSVRLIFDNDHVHRNGVYRSIVMPFSAWQRMARNSSVASETEWRSQCDDVSVLGKPLTAEEDDIQL